MKFQSLFITLLAAMLVSATAHPDSVSAERADVYVYVDGDGLDVDPGAYSENGRTMVPMRAIFEALHAQVQWDAPTKTVIGKTADKTVELQLDSKTATVNGKSVTLDAPAQQVDGRVMVPLRFVSESLGYQVYFNDKGGYFGDRSQVNIFTNPQVTLTYRDFDMNLNADDYGYSYYFTPSVRYLFTDGSRIHILHADQPGGTRPRSLSPDGPAGVTIYHFDTQLNPLGKTDITGELPVFGGFHQSEDGFYYIAYGKHNLQELEGQVVYSIVKYDAEWKKVGQADIRDVYTAIPYDGSNVTMESRDGKLVVHSARTRYTSEDGKRHQSNITFQIRTSDMEVLDKGGHWPKNHVSHSFATYVRFDGSRIVYADHGDAYPRSIVLQTEDYGGMTNERDIITFPGEIGENHTGAMLGGLEVSDTHYLLVGSSIVPKLSYVAGYSANLFVAALPKQGVAQGEVKLNWLTDLKGASSTSMNPTVDESHLVPLSGGRYAVIWSQTGDDAIGTYYAIVDGTGATVKAPVRLGGVPAPGNVEPLVLGDQLIWYGLDGSKTAFYTIDLSK